MEPGAWFQSIPKITRFLFVSSFVVTLAGNFGVVSPMSLVFSWSMIWHKFQIWRLITCVFFFGKLGFPFLIQLYFIYSYSNRVETGAPFEHRPADYVHMLLFSWLVLLIIAWLFEFMIVGPGLVIAIVYVWSMHHAEETVTFWFGTRFKAMYLPWVLFIFNILTGGNGLMELIGIVAGHGYYFLRTVYPRDHHGPALLETPAFLRTYFPDTRGIAGFGEPAAARRVDGGAEQPRQWGRGHVLGRD